MENHFNTVTYDDKSAYAGWNWFVMDELFDATMVGQINESIDGLNVWTEEWK